MGPFFFSFFVVDFSHLACLVCLLQGEDEGLKSGKMSNELENPENPHHANLHGWINHPHSKIDNLTSRMIFPVFPMIWKSSRPSSKRER